MTAWTACCASLAEFTQGTSRPWAPVSQKAQDDGRKVRRDPDERCDVVQFSCAHQVFAVAGLEGPVLAVKNHEIPGLVAQKVNSRRVSGPQETAKNGLPGFELSFGLIGSHVFSCSCCYGSVKYLDSRSRVNQQWGPFLSGERGSTFNAFLGNLLSLERKGVCPKSNP